MCTDRQPYELLGSDGSERELPGEINAERVEENKNGRCGLKHAVGKVQNVGSSNFSQLFGDRNQSEPLLACYGHLVLRDSLGMAVVIQKRR
jgi:hypothetical protein